MGPGERRGYRRGAEGLFTEDLLASDYEDGPVYADKRLVVTRTENPAGFRFAGEIDITNSAAVAESLRLALGGDGDPHVDVSRLSFCDISGIRALVDAALAIGDGRCMLLHGLPPQLETVMRATGWSQLPSLTLCNCVGGER